MNKTRKWKPVRWTEYCQFKQTWLFNFKINYHTHIWLFIKVIEQHQKRVPQEIFIVLNNSTLHLKNILQSQEENKVSYNWTIISQTNSKTL